MASVMIAKELATAPPMISASMSTIEIITAQRSLLASSSAWEWSFFWSIACTEAMTAQTFPKPPEEAKLA